MVKLGITGRIASGKTTAAKEFAKFNGKVISADRIGKDVVENNPPVLSKLIRAFGPQIVTPHGVLLRRELGNLAFKSLENKQTLNRIVHPPLLKSLKEKLDMAVKSGKYDLVIVDAALLIDWNWQSYMDFTVCVVANRKTQIMRLHKKGLNEQEIEDRLNAQLSDLELAKASDFVLENNGSPKQLQQNVKKIYDEIMARSRE